MVLYVNSTQNTNVTKNPLSFTCLRHMLREAMNLSILSGHWRMPEQLQGSTASPHTHLLILVPLYCS